MTHLQQKTAPGLSLATTPGAVDTHGFVNVKNDVGDTHPHFHCNPAGSPLQPSARTAAFDTLRRRAERGMREDEARYGDHFLVWLSLTCAANDVAWPPVAGRGRGEKARGRGVRG
jgi:hypothetical protein